MSRRLLSLLFTAVSLIAVGCAPQGAANPSASVTQSSGGVGVVDLDAVAKALGRDMEMSHEAEQKIAQLNSELTSLQEALNRQFSDQREELGEDLSDDQKRQLLLSKNKLETQFRDKKTLAERRFAKYKLELVAQFREETKPVLKAVAASRGLSIVIPKNDALLLTVAAEVDLTDAVVLELRKLTPAKATAESTPAKPKRRPAAETSARD